MNLRVCTPFAVAATAPRGPLDQLAVHDGFSGKSSILAGGTTQTATVNPDGTMDLVVSGGGTTGSFAFDRNDYCLYYFTVSGAFDWRVRMRARNTANTDQPPASAFRLTGIHVADPANNGSVNNFVHLVRGTVNATQNRIEWKTNDDNGGASSDVSAFNSIACPVAAASYVDLRMVRRAASMQLIELYSRDPVATTDVLDDSVSWSAVLAGHVDRTSNAQPARAVNGAAANLAVQLPETVRLGFIVYASTNPHDTRGDFIQSKIRRPS